MVGEPQGPTCRSRLSVEPAGGTSTLTPPACPLTGSLPLSSDFKRAHLPDFGSRRTRRTCGTGVPISESGSSPLPVQPVHPSTLHGSQIHIVSSCPVSCVTTTAPQHLRPPLSPFSFTPSRASISFSYSFHPPAISFALPSHRSLPSVRSVTSMRPSRRARRCAIAPLT